MRFLPIICLVRIDITPVNKHLASFLLQDRVSKTSSDSMKMQSFQDTETAIQMTVVSQTVLQPTNAPQFRVSWLDTDELRSREKAWEFLALNSLSQNPAFESNYLLPALKHLANESVRVLVVEDVRAEKHHSLVGLVPIEDKCIYRLPFKAAEIWKHEQCFDTTPLLLKKHASEVWRLICEELVEVGFKLLSLDTVSAETNVDAVFTDLERGQGIVRFQRDHYQRAAFVPTESFDDYVQKHVSKSIRKNTKRLLRRLEDRGTVTWETSGDSSDFEQLAEDFMSIEASGWKGTEGTALASAESTKAFYKSLICESARVGKARFLSLKLDGRPLAMLSDIQTGQVVYSCKTAYDEKFAQFSPGQQVEVKNLDFLHRDGIQSGDSCTSTENATINRIWGQKLSFQNLIFSLTPGLARTAVKALPMIQTAVHRLRNK
ncbi:MAG: hypothetical protein ACI814_000941 [Mariniblastus sp.]|jgi:hypothetical protein